MILVGQYDSPYTRRVAVSLHLLDFAFEHDTRSVRRFRFHARDQSAGPHSLADLRRRHDIDRFGSDPRLARPGGRAGTRAAPSRGRERQQALQRIALATGTIDKAGAAAYERLMRPAERRWPEWVARCRTQAEGGIAALAAQAWPADAPICQVRITTACMVSYVRMADPDLLPPGRYPALDALSQRCEALAPFKAAWPGDAYGLPAP